MGRVSRQSRVDKNTLPSRVNHPRVAGDLNYQLHEICLQHQSEFSFTGVPREDRHRNWPIAIRDCGRWKVADLEAIEAVAVYSA